jgi:hypothetical protein
MGTRFIKANVKYFCLEDKKRHSSNELMNRCGGCVHNNKCTVATAIERLKGRRK